MSKKELHNLILQMQPVLNSGEFVYVTLPDRNLVAREDTIFEFVESEGYTVILPRSAADKYGLSYEYIAAWITLKVHSSLQAIGFTAAFSSALADQKLSCNVVAGFYHDHIFVEYGKAQKAMEVLRGLSDSYLL